MKKLFSLIRATMSEGMNLFKINTKKSSAFTKAALPIFLSLVLMFAFYTYSDRLMEILVPMNLEYIALSIFAVGISVVTLIEGVYKSGNLLFNCKDDNLLLSLPIKRSTVLFIRVLKFYLFELLYNTVFLLPAMINYAIRVNPTTSYYIVSAIGLLLLPIVPILISCLIGTFISSVASKFKGKNIVQTIISIGFVLGVLYLTYNSDSLVSGITQNATNINYTIAKVYYPVGEYIELVTSFNITKLLVYVAIHIALFAVTVLLIGKVYFNINSSVKSIKKKKTTNKEYKIKSSSPVKSIVKKELNRFFNSPVFVSNAAFGLVLYIIGCILVALKFDSFSNTIVEMGFTVEKVASYIPTLAFGFLCFTAFMTSITSSMISLEGKSFNILKSLPQKPSKIVNAKVLSAICIMLPCILIGDLILFIRFKMDIISILLLLVASVLLPLISETIGIIVNLKYPRMDAQNDTEVVKQSMSSSVSVFMGMGIIGLALAGISAAIAAGFSSHLVILMCTGVFAVIYILLLLLLRSKCDKWFDNINV